jgi:hypothetical protein
MLENLYFAPWVGQGNPECMTVEIKVDGLPIAMNDTFVFHLIPCQRYLPP